MPNAVKATATTTQLTTQITATLAILGALGVVYADLRSHINESLLRQEERVRALEIETAKLHAEIKVLRAELQVYHGRVELGGRGNE